VTAGRPWALQLVNVPITGPQASSFELGYDEVQLLQFVVIVVRTTLGIPFLLRPPVIGMVGAWRRGSTTSMDLFYAGRAGRKGGLV
jgi:hypothetical protein